MFVGNFENLTIVSKFTKLKKALTAQVCTSLQSIWLKSKTNKSIKIPFYYQQNVPHNSATFKSRLVLPWQHFVNKTFLENL